MSGVTEVVSLPLKAGVSLNPNDDTGTIFQDALTTLLDQPGVQRVCWGTEIETPSSLRLFVDWDAVASHEQFQKAPAYQPFLQTLGKIMDGRPTLYHCALAPHPPTTALGVNTPICEILTVYFPASVSDSTRSEFESRLKKLVSVMESNASAEAYRGSAGGWSVENDVSRDGSDDKCKVFLALLGWESVDAHKSFSQTQEFKDNIYLLREAEGVVGTTMSHVDATENHAGGLGAEERGAIDASGDSTGNAQEEILNPQRGEKVAPKSRSDGTTTKNSS